MVKGDNPTKLKCENPLIANLKLANELGIIGTPTIYLNNGEQSQNIQELFKEIKANNK
jgi:thiol:disulfide interchange protein DsbC